MRKALRVIRGKRPGRLKAEKPPHGDRRPHRPARHHCGVAARVLTSPAQCDTGTQHLPQIADKPTDYAEQARMPVGLAFRMPSLFCFPAPRREQTARKALPANGASQALHIATAALDPSATCPACGPTWMPLHGGYGPMRLVDLGDVLPALWRIEREHDEQDQHELDPAETGWDEVESDRL